MWPVGSASGLGTGEGLRVGESRPGPCLRTILAQHRRAHVRGERESEWGPTSGDVGAQKHLVLLSVRLNYSVKLEAAPTYQIIDELNYSALSNHTGFLQK